RHAAAAREPLSGLHPALDIVDLGRFHHRLSRLRRGARRPQPRARHARLPLRLRHRAALARGRGGVVGAADPHPDDHRTHAPVPHERGAAVSAASPRGRMRRILIEGGSALLALVLLIWSLLPVYNMFLIALDPEE